MGQPETIMIDDVKYIREDSIQQIRPADSDYVLIRGNRSGVFFGNLITKDGQEVLIGNVIRIYFWDGANTLSELSAHGTCKPDECKFLAPIDRITVLDAIEIIPCTQKAVDSIKGVTSWVH